VAINKAAFYLVLTKAVSLNLQWTGGVSLLHVSCGHLGEVHLNGSVWSTDGFYEGSILSTYNERWENQSVSNMSG
jgi:hypothetical protein